MSESGSRGGTWPLPLAGVGASGLRLLAWLGLPMLLVIRTAVWALDLDAAQELVLADLFTYLLPMALALGGAWSLVARSPRHNVERRFWTLLGVALGANLIGESHWTWYSAAVDMRGPSLGGMWALFGLAAVAAFFMMAVTLTRMGLEPLSSRLRLYIDVFALLAACYPFVFLFWTRPAFSFYPDTVRGAAVAAAYPLVALAVIAAAAAIMLGWRAYRWRMWEKLTVIAVFAFGVSLGLFPLWYPEHYLSGGTTVGWFAFLMGCAYWLLFIGEVYRMTTDSADELPERMPARRYGPHWASSVAPIALAASLPVLCWLVFRVSGTPSYPVVLGATVLVALLLAARSWLVGLELAHHRLRAITDPVTGVYNSRYLHEEIESLVSYARDVGREVVVLEFDAENLRDYNEMYGHVAGDAVLREIARIVNARVSGRGETYRLGSDELIAVLDNGTIDEGTRLAHHIVDLLAGHRGIGAAPMIGVSVGVAGFPESALDGRGVLACAHAATRAARMRDDAVAVFEPATETPDSAEQYGRARMRALRRTVQTLASAVDARDPATRDHSANVARLAREVSVRIGLSADRVRIVEFAALLHDVGKIGISDDVLLSTGPLDEAQRERIELHPVLGESICSSARLEAILPVVRHHHERWDGGGYPDGLAGHEIPLEARIMAVCDAFETMVSGRPYRNAMTVKEAIAEVSRGSGTQFDPMVAETFVALFARPGRAAMLLRLVEDDGSA